MVFNMTVVMLNTAMHPMPEGIDFNDAEGQAASIGTLPWMAFVLIPVAHVGQAFFGVLISATITPKASVVVAMIVGVLSMLAGIANLLSMPLPAWMWIDMPMCRLAAGFAARIVLSRRAGKHPETDSSPSTRVPPCKSPDSSGLFACSSIGTGDRRFRAPVELATGA